MDSAQGDTEQIKEKILKAQAPEDVQEKLLNSQHFKLLPEIQI